MTSVKAIDRLFVATWMIVSVYSVMIVADAVAVHPLPASASPICLEGTSK
ncbi:hypothetical protein GGE65_007671 [Skermanella aerolata]